MKIHLFIWRLFNIYVPLYFWKWIQVVFLLDSLPALTSVHVYTFAEKCGRTTLSPASPREGVPLISRRTLGERRGSALASVFIYHSCKSLFRVKRIYNNCASRSRMRLSISLSIPKLDSDSWSITISSYTKRTIEFARRKYSSDSGIMLWPILEERRWGRWSKHEVLWELLQAHLAAAADASGERQMKNKSFQVSSLLVLSSRFVSYRSRKCNTPIRHIDPMIFLVIPFANVASNAPPLLTRTIRYDDSCELFITSVINIYVQNVYTGCLRPTY